jgi:hypothetical protein
VPSVSSKRKIETSQQVCLRQECFPFPSLTHSRLFLAPKSSSIRRFCTAPRVAASLPCCHSGTRTRGFEFWRNNAGSDDQARARSRRAANTPRGWRAPRHGATCQPKTRHPGDGPNDFDGRNSRNDFGKKNKSAHPPPPPHVPHQLWRRGSAHHRDVVPANFACPHVSSSVRD